jgi:hypothetical protein
MRIVANVCLVNPHESVKPVGRIVPKYSSIGELPSYRVISNLSLINKLIVSCRLKNQVFYSFETIFFLIAI